MSILIENIKELVQVEEIPRLLVKGKDMAKLKTIKNAFLFIENGIISAFGKMAELDKQGILLSTDNVKAVDANGKMVFPSFVDSHTHLVYPASREIEYIDKIKGLSYEEIAQRGGGILNSAKLMQDTSDEELVENALVRLNEIISYGTGAVEIKSGYGLTVESELKMLRVIKRLKQLSPLTIKATFLGAHSIPMEYRDNQEKYVDIVDDFI